MVGNSLFAAGLLECIVDTVCVETVVVVVARVPCMDKHLLAQVVIEHRRLTVGVIGCLEVKCMEMVALPDEERVVGLYVGGREVVCPYKQVGLGKPLFVRAFV